MIKKETAVNTNQILFVTNPYLAVGAVITDDGTDANEHGNKIVKAGTPVAGDLEDRTTAFTIATGANAVGVLVHDVDVTEGANNGTVMLLGAVNTERLDEETKELITDDVKAALKTIFFCA